MNQRDFEIIIALHKHLNLTKAAKDLYISQPALTKRIFQLEERFHKKLIARHSKGILFTDYGVFFYRYAVQILKQIQNLEDELISSYDDVSGVLRIGVSNIYAHYRLPKILRDFSQLYPKVQFEIYADRSTKVFDLLRNNDVSLAIVRGNFAWKSSKIKLSEENICLAYHKKIDLTNLHKVNYIEYLTEPTFQSQINTWLNENLIELPQTSTSTSSIDTCLEFVKNGLGWSIVANIGLDDFEGYKENLFNIDNTPLTRTTYLYFKEESLHSKPVKAFVDFITNYQ